MGAADALERARELQEKQLARRVQQMRNQAARVMQQAQAEADRAQKERLKQKAQRRAELVRKEKVNAAPLPPGTGLTLAATPCPPAPAPDRHALRKQELARERAQLAREAVDRKAQEDKAMAEQRRAQAEQRARILALEKRRAAEERAQKARDKAARIKVAQKRSEDLALEKVNVIKIKEMKVLANKKHHEAMQRLLAVKKKAEEEDKAKHRQEAFARAEARRAEKVTSLLQAKEEKEAILKYNREVQNQLREQRHLQHALKVLDTQQNVAIAEQRRRAKQAEVEAQLEEKRKRVEAREQKQRRAMKQMQETRKENKLQQDQMKKAIEDMERTKKIDKKLMQSFGDLGEGDPLLAGAGASASTSPPRRPKSGERPGSAKRGFPKAPKYSTKLVTEIPDPIEAQLRRIIEEEQMKEAERDGILSQITDPRERQRLHKLFNIERDHAKRMILDLSAQLH